MKTFKTPKGTELPLANIKGKDYLVVAYRLVWFREEHPDWGIQTKLDIDFKEKRCVAHAEIIDSTGKLIASAHKIEDSVGFGDYSEKAETGAIGRALGMCGYGTQFAPEFDEGDRIVDSPIAKPNPHAAKNNQPEPGDGVQFNDEFCFPAMAVPLSYLARKPISKTEEKDLKRVIEVLTEKYGKGNWPAGAEFTVEECYKELDKRGIK